MTQIEQKEIIQEQIDILNNQLITEESYLKELEEELEEAQDKYDEQEDFVRGVRKNIKDLKDSIGVVCEGQMSIMDYNL